MHGSLVSSKKRILKGRNNSSAPDTTYELISDIGSGSTSNDRVLRPYWNEQVMVSEIVVIHHDQLCRFAFDLIQYILSLHTTKLVVLFNDATSDEHKLSQDILAINTIFICQMQGRRAAMHQREWKVKDNKNNKHMEQKKGKPKQQ